MLILVSILKDHNKSSTATIRWTPGSINLADALTKDNQVVSKLYDNLLKTGLHIHPECSFTSAAHTTAWKSWSGVLAMTRLPESLVENQLQNRPLAAVCVHSAFSPTSFNDTATTRLHQAPLYSQHAVLIVHQS